MKITPGAIVKVLPSGARPQFLGRGERIQVLLPGDVELTWICSKRVSYPLSGSGEDPWRLRHYAAQLRNLGYRLFEMKEIDMEFVCNGSPFQMTSVPTGSP